MKYDFNENDFFTDMATKVKSVFKVPSSGAYGENSKVSGEDSIAYGKNSIAQGFNTLAVGENSVAEGESYGPFLVNVILSESSYEDSGGWDGKGG